MRYLTFLLPFVLLTGCQAGTPENSGHPENPDPEANPVAVVAEPEQAAVLPAEEATPVTVAEEKPTPPPPAPKAEEPAPPEKKPVKKMVVPEAAPGKEAERTPPAEEAPAPPPSHEGWDAQLRQYVDAAGNVDYRTWKEDGARLREYLKLLAENPVQKEWPRAEKMAYWINAYNAFTVKLILDNYPLSSITDLHAGKPWDVAWIELGDQTYSLNNIENDILRPRYREPRIHFAVNCAARSCPPLLNRAWTAANLERYFEQQTRSFINNPAYNEWQPDGLKVSRIFDWYRADFGDLTAFLNRYAATPLPPDAEVGFLEYDWRLNGR